MADEPLRLQATLQGDKLVVAGLKNMQNEGSTGSRAHRHASRRRGDAYVPAPGGEDIEGREVEVRADDRK
jgi:hypothetical protein